MKVKYLHINQFRHVNGVKMEFGKRMTAIAGQNGSGKSSILGLVGHVFVYRNQTSIKTLSNKNFETVYSEIFKFSYPEFDKPKNHNYEVELSDGNKIAVTSYDRIEKDKDKSLRFRVGKSSKGGGKIQHPVIYLGLRRLFPLAQEENISFDKSILLNEQEKEIYQKLHNEILLLDEEIIPEYVETVNKKSYGARTKKYDSIGNSAGQDNIGQIITAILSFRRLKEQKGNDYEGGILLIDEIDSTLYPAAQTKLIEKLFRWAQNLDLQIIFTTHSLEVLEFISNEYKQSNDCKIIYLSNSSGNIENEQDEVSIKEIINDLKVLPPSKEEYNKIPVFCEDEEARLWIKNLLPIQIKNKLEFVNETFGCGELVQWAGKKISPLKNSIFVIDGDQFNSIKKTNKNSKLVLLPGKESPEKLFFNYLKSLDAGCDFWGRTGGYTKQVCFRNLNSISDNRVVMKNWLKEQKTYCGRGYSRLFTHWKNSHLKEAETFNDEFIEIVYKIEGN
ncbi:AAA family ATPase [uncultured Methanolobus sp.]|uniref:AAA family ATPase n=1 Tax=uncultured Methanolobus sp. TaxID=218300 RepID=UPI0029C92781|nr:AAA family ATPase [uncultured Methanolobus sp.]